MEITMDKEFIKFNSPQISLNISSVTYVPGGFIRGPHYHSAVELVSVKKGDLLCRIGSTSVPLLAGETLIVNKNVVHSIECVNFGTEFSYIQTELDNQFVSSVKDDIYHIHQFIDKSSPMQYCVCGKNSELSVLFDNIRGEFYSNKPYTTLYLQGYIIQLNAFMHRYGIAKAIRFINNHYTDKIYIEDVAATINLNKFRLCKRFKALTGGTVTEYINFIRLHYASEMLLNSGKTVTEIAYSCGFASVQYFNKVFKQSFGCSPKQFKDSSSAELQSVPLSENDEV